MVNASRCEAYIAGGVLTGLHMSIITLDLTNVNREYGSNSYSFRGLRNRQVYVIIDSIGGAIT